MEILKPRCRRAGRQISRSPSHVRHTLAAAGEPLKLIQESLGHVDLKTTQIYAHYAPSIREREMVNGVFGALTTRDGGHDEGQTERNSGELGETQT